MKMKKQTHQEFDELRFDELLRSAEVEVPLPGAFQSEVWRRIATAQESTFKERCSRAIEGLFGFMAQPVAASAMVLTMIGAGLWLGSVGEEPLRDGKLTYVQSVSPFAHAVGGETR